MGMSACTVGKLDMMAQLPYACKVSSRSKSQINFVAESIQYSKVHVLLHNCSKFPHTVGMNSLLEISKGMQVLSWHALVVPATWAIIVSVAMLAGRSSER